MRINYYRFPEGIDPHTRYKNGACHKAGHCDIDQESCRGCPVCEGGWSESVLKQRTPLRAAL